MDDAYELLEGRPVQDLFTDRESECATFREAIEVHRARLDRDELPLDRAAPRLNVLSFYGVGGVGKTELSRRLEAWVTGRLPSDDRWGPAPSARGLIDPSRIDLRTTGGAIDVLAVLLDIRDRLPVDGVDWSAFDLAFTLYWQVVSHGAPLPAAHREGPFAEAAGETLANVLSDLGLLAGVAGLGVRAAVAVARGIRDRRVQRGALASCPMLAPLLEQIPHDSSPEVAVRLALLMGWHLDHMAAEDRPLITVFVDTYEDLTEDAERRSERTFNSLVHVLPQVLWVVTGRNALDWTASSAVQLLPHPGPATWPGLVPGCDRVPRQHLIGNLSEHDARIVLLKACETWKLDIGGDLLDRVVRSSHGLPLYLDLVVQVARHATQAGRAVTEAEVTDSLGNLVRRLLRDVPADERRALRAGALAPRFDLTTTAVAAGVDQGAVRRATRRPMVSQDDHPIFPFRLHDEVRAAVLQDPGHQGDAWEEGDWQAAAQRAADSLHQRHEGSTDVEERFHLTVQGLQVLAQRDVEAPWLVRAVAKASSLRRLAVERPLAPATQAGRAMDRFLSSWDPGVRGPERRQRLAEVSSPDLAGPGSPLALSAERFALYSLRGANRFEAAAEGFTALCRSHPSPLHTYQLGITYSQMRRFDDALGLAHELADVDPLRSRRLQGHVWQGLGRVAEALEAANEWYERQVREGSARLAMEVRCHNLFRASMLDRTVLAEVEEAVDVAEQQFESSNLRTLLAAQAMCSAGDEAAVAEVSEEIRAIGRSAGLLEVAWKVVLPLVFDAAVRGDDDAMVGALELCEMRSRAGRMWVPIEMLASAAGHPIEATASTQWVDDEDTVRGRWWALVEQRREQLSR